jgi:hypothetical protein
VYVYRDGNGINTVNPGFARRCHHPHPHRPNLGASEHWEAIPARYFTLQVVQQCYGISHAIFDYPKYRRWVPIGQAASDSLPSFAVWPVALADPELGQQFIQNREGNGCCLRGFEKFRVRLKKVAAGSPQTHSVPSPIQCRNESQEQAPGAVWQIGGFLQY